MAIDTVILHATVFEELAAVIQHFADPQTKVSAHYTIDKDGTIVQHVPDLMRAWHAGVSEMPDGREKVNDFSIGIELVNRNDGTDPYPPEQCQALTALLRELISHFPISAILSHAEIARPAGRKSDPRGLDLDPFQALL